MEHSNSHIINKCKYPYQIVCKVTQFSRVIEKILRYHAITFFLEIEVVEYRAAFAAEMFIYTFGFIGEHLLDLFANAISLTVTHYDRLT